MTLPLELSLDVSAVPAHPGGAGHYTMALARGLAAHPDVALTLVARRGDTGRWQDLAGGTPCRDAVPRSRPVRLAFEQLGLPKLLRSIGASLHHGPHYTMPERSPVPCAVTIHDCTFFDHPEWHVRSKAAFFRRAIRRAAQRAAVLICVSQTTAERLHASCPVRVPVVVAPHGVDHARFAPDEAAAGADRAALAALGIPDERPLVVFVGTLEPRKGVASLVAAFDRIASADSDVVLVLGGQPGWGLDATEEALGVARHRDRVVRTGYLPDAAVPALLRCAAAVAYPALEEGFGLPALEALACAAPLVTTEGTAMAEFAGNAALLVPRGDVDALAEALQKALDEGRNTSRTARGLAVAAEHTWEATVTRHLHAYDLAESASQ
jgi:glycosyltransferase involved in cell wall biosynthesis